MRLGDLVKAGVVNIVNKVSENARRQMYEILKKYGNLPKSFIKSPTTHDDITATEIVYTILEKAIFEKSDEAEKDLKKLHDLAPEALGNRSNLTKVLTNIVNNLETIEIRYMIYTILNKYGTIPRTYVTKNTIHDEIDASKIVHKMLKMLVEGCTNTKEVEQDLQKLYTLSRKLAKIENKYNNVLVTLEASALRSLINIKRVKEITIPGAKARIVTTRTNTYTTITPAPDEQESKTSVKIEPKITICPDTITGIRPIYTPTGKLATGEITPIGAKSHVDLPYHSDYIAFTDALGRFIRTEYKSFGHDFELESYNPLDDY